MAKAALLSVNLWGYSDTSRPGNLIKDCWRARAAVPKMSPNSLTAATDGGAGSSLTLGETGRGRGRDCRDGVTSGGDHHNGRITIRTCSGEARVCKRVGQVKQNKQKSNKQSTRSLTGRKHRQWCPQGRNYGRSGLDLGLRDGRRKVRSV